jgi:hypothetical protein
MAAASPKSPGSRNLWKARREHAPLPEDSYLVPGAQYRDTEIGEVFHVTRD